MFGFAKFLAVELYAAVFVTLTSHGHVFSRRPPPFADFSWRLEEIKERQPAKAAVECQSVSSDEKKILQRHLLKL